MNNLLYIPSLSFLNFDMRKKVYKMMFSIDLTVSVTATLNCGRYTLGIRERLLKSQNSLYVKKAMQIVRT